MSHPAHSQSITSKILRTIPIAWKNLQFIQQEDFKEWITAGDEKLQQSILRYQFVDPFKVWQDGDVIYCLDGKHRHDDLLAIERNGITVPEFLDATFIDCRDRKEAAELVLVYSSHYARITQQGLFDFIQTNSIDWQDMKFAIDLPAFDDVEFQSLFNAPDELFSPTQIVARSLQERFLIPPFSILDTRQGYWQDRKKIWQQLNFNSQETRENVELMANSAQPPAVYELRNTMRDKLHQEPTWDEITAYAKEKGIHLYHGASIFDPVLTEILYSWFCMPGAAIVDPFAGGSVRGIVAAMLGYSYFGIDLRPDQVNANQKQWDTLQSEAPENCQAPQWYVGDSQNMPEILPQDRRYDFVFSCPPYHDLEQYSKDPADLSNMSYDEFLKAYRIIIQQAVSRLRDDRFACFVVGDIRDKAGFYRNFVSDTISAFQDAGMHLYNEMILINNAGSLAIRAGRQFAISRKVGKTHQNVLVFFKGDPKTIRKNYPEVVVPDFEEEETL